MSTEKPTIGVIAICGRSLAIFGSNLGFLGPVIQDYEKFEDESSAILSAKDKIRAMGLPIEEKISRPRITSMRVSFGRSTRKRAARNRAGEDGR